MPADTETPAAYGRYLVFRQLAAGGMGSLHFGRIVGSRGFSRTVAIKRLHAFLATESVVAMFLEEARIASRVRHPNVVPTLDVIEQGQEVLIVMEYIEGQALSKLVATALAREQPIPLPIVSRVMGDVLHGLDAAHEAKGDHGKPLQIVHRDVSPQNVLVGVDGVSRVADFGIAKANDRVHRTAAGEVKGKLRYLAPEQLVHEEVDRRADVYAAGVMLWELIVGKPMRSTRDVRKLTSMVMQGTIVAPSTILPVDARLEAVVLRALERDPEARFPYARQMADALHEAEPPATAAVVAAWVKELAAEHLAECAAYVEHMATGAALESIAAPSTEDVITRMEARPVIADVKPPPHSGRSHSGKKVILAGAISGALMLGVVGLAFFGAARKDESAAPAFASSASDHASFAHSPSTLAPPVVSASPPSSATTRSPIHHRSPSPQQHPDCRIPFTLDKSGVRIPRPECM